MKLFMFLKVLIRSNNSTKKFCDGHTYVACVGEVVKGIVVISEGYGSDKFVELRPNFWLEYN